MRTALDSIVPARSSFICHATLKDAIRSSDRRSADTIQGRYFSRHFKALRLRRASQLHRIQSCRFTENTRDKDTEINRCVGKCSLDYWTSGNRALGFERTQSNGTANVVERRTLAGRGASLWELPLQSH